MMDRRLYLQNMGDGRIEWINSYEVQQVTYGTYSTDVSIAAIDRDLQIIWEWESGLFGGFSLLLWPISSLGSISLSSPPVSSVHVTWWTRMLSDKSKAAFQNCCGEAEWLWTWDPGRLWLSWPHDSHNILVLIFLWPVSSSVKWP
jgi:hypothetical protein